MMSAFMVSEAHVDALVTLAVLGPIDGRQCGPPGVRFHHRNRWETATFETADVLAALLATANVDSLRARYPRDWKCMTWDGTGEAAQVHEWTARPRPSVVEGLKLLDCYEYQSCEVRDWEATDAAKFCRGLRSDLISEVPGYDDAPWGID
jgi:hypothetical protein